MDIAQLIALINENGWFIVIVCIILLNIGKVTQTLERGLGKLFPLWAQRREEQLQREEQARLRREKEQLDTILVLKDMLLQYRTELDDAKLERKQLHNVIVELVGKYERLAAQTVEVIRDISQIVRLQGERLEAIEGKIDGTRK